MDDDVNDDRLLTVLRAADRSIEPPAALSAQIKAEMIQTLRSSVVDTEPQATSADINTDSVLDSSPVVLLEPARATRRRRWPMIAAAAAAATVVIGAIALSPRDEVSTVATAAEQNYLRACIDFQESTSLDGEPWFRVVDGLEPGTPDTSLYLAALADAADALALAELASPARAELARAAAMARSDDAIDRLAALETELDNARRALSINTGVPCLDLRPVSDAAFSRSGG